MSSYYYKIVDGKAIINADLVTSEAEKAAQSFFPPQARDSGKTVELKATQLRKFYRDAKGLELRLKNSSDKDLVFLQILPLIKLLKAKSAYACKREVVPEAFRKWLWDKVDKIEDRRDFEAFLLHFEAVMGFSYGLAPRGYN